MPWRLVDLQTGRPYIDMLWERQEQAEAIRQELLKFHRNTPWWDRLQVISSDIAITRGRGRPVKKRLRERPHRAFS